MDLPNLKLNRLLGKQNDQNDQTKSPAYTGANPVPKSGNDDNKKIGKPDRNNEDGGAPNIITGTVITSCIIQTSALPSRAELAGNDLTFYDDTYEKDGQVLGDTSRIVFTHDLDSNEGFIIEKRASIYNTYDNVLSIYANPAKEGAYNYMFIGRNGDANDPKRNVDTIHMAINRNSAQTIDPNNSLNGTFVIEYSSDGVLSSAGSSPLFLGNSEQLFPSAGFTGFSSFINAAEGGVVGIGYYDTVVPVSLIPGIYMLTKSEVLLGVNFIPDTDNAYDIGSSSKKIKTIYATSISASTLSSGGLTWFSGTGSPEGVVTAPIGSLYSNKSGGASTTLYVKTSGSGNTGWTAK